MSRKFCNVMYFVPEDGETEKNMNIFLIPTDPSEVTLGEIRAEFPLPGDYHFRFSYSYKSTDCKVWIDLCSENQHVPLVDGEIRMKVARKNWVGGAQDHHRVQASDREV